MELHSELRNAPVEEDIPKAERLKLLKLYWNYSLVKWRIHGVTVAFVSEADHDRKEVLMVNEVLESNLEERARF